MPTGAVIGWMGKLGKTLAARHYNFDTPPTGLRELLARDKGPINFISSHAFVI